jgi:hypothetical protein
MEELIKITEKDGIQAVSSRLLFTKRVWTISENF